MAEYFKYKQRDPQLQVNWAQIGQDVVNTIDDEVKFREEKKAEIDAATKETMDLLNNEPRGESTSLTEWALNYGATATESMMQWNSLLKSGQMKPKDFTIRRQNLQEGTEQAFALVKEYQKVYDTKMERMKSNDPNKSSQQLETYLMENSELFANFDKSELITNPETGKVMVAMKKYNPKTGVMELSKDPNDMVAVSALKGQLLGEYNEYNSNAATDGFVKSSGVWTEMLRDVGTRLQKGSWTEINNAMSKMVFTDGKRVLNLEQAEALGIPQEDLKQVNLYLQAEDAFIKSQFTNDYNVTSVLTENVGVASNGEPYTYTFNDKEAKGKPNVILLNREGGKVVPQITKEQREDAANYMKTVIRNKQDIGQTVTNVSDYTAPMQPQQWQIDRADKKKMLNNLASYAAALYGGNEEEKTAAVNAFEKATGAQISYTDNNKVVVLTYPTQDGGKTETKIPLYDNASSPIGPQNFQNAVMNTVEAGWRTKDEKTYTGPTLTGTSAGSTYTPPATTTVEPPAVTRNAKGQLVDEYGLVIEE